MKIAMAAAFDIKNNKSWSGTPLSLYNGLCNYEDNEIETINLAEYHTDKLIKKNIIDYISVKKSIKARHPVSKLGPAFMNPLNSRILNDVFREKDSDVLIEFGGFLPGDNLPPYYVYTDASHDMSIDFYEKSGHMPFNNDYSLAQMKIAADFVRPIYQNAAGIFCMSDYLAETMIKRTGVDKEKVHTVYAGANWHGVSLPEAKEKSIDSKETIDLLLTGVDYYRKGTDLAVEAVRYLNEKHKGRFILHLCGAKEKPIDDLIVNHGFVNKNELVNLLQQCDLFVLPSRFDCFGIAFAEAMTFGLPCIGRNICAMPEIIDEGINGELVEDDDPVKLAELIEKICSDSELYRSYSLNAIEKAKRFTWERVCADIMDIIYKDIRKS